MSCEERAWLTNQPGVSLCTHVFGNGFGRPHLRSRVKEARPLYSVSTTKRDGEMNKTAIGSFVRGKLCEPSHLDPFSGMCYHSFKVKGNSMRNLKVALAAACAVVVGWAFTASADIPASAYVQDGLIAQWDSLEKTGAEAPGNWTDIKRGDTIPLLANDAVGDTSVRISAAVHSLECLKGCDFDFRAPMTLEVRAKTAAYAASKTYTMFNIKYRAALGFDTRYTPTGGSCFNAAFPDGNGETLRLYYDNLNSLDRTETANYHTYSAASELSKTCTAYCDGSACTFAGGLKWTDTTNNYGTPDGTASLGSANGAIDYNSIRVYNRALTANEVAYNANIDKIRFEGANPATLTWPDGYRWNAETEKIECRLRVLTGGERGTITIDGTEIAEDDESWFEVGGAHTIVATPAEGWKFVRWEGDGLAVADKISATLTTTRALSLTAVFYAEDETAVRYYPLEYVEGNGAQWVNTEQTLKCGQTFRILWSQNPEITYVNAGCNGAWGADTYVQGWQGAGYKQANGYPITAYHNGYNGFSPEFNSGNFVLGDLYEDVCRVGLDFFGYTMCHVADGAVGNITAIANAEGESYETKTPIYLLRNSVTTSYYMAYKRVHLATLSETSSGTGVFNLVPVVKEEDQDDGTVVETVMLYDTVNGAEFTNMTKTALIAGPRTEANGARWTPGNLELETAVSVSGDGTFAVDDGAARTAADLWTVRGGTVTLKAVPSEGSAFVGWSGEIGEEKRRQAEIVLTVDRARKLVARFAPAGEADDYWVFSSDGFLRHASNGIVLKARVGQGNLTVQSVSTLADETTVDLTRPIYTEDMSATLPLTTISANAFKSNTSLRHFKMPDTVTTIGGSAFQSCTSLLYVRMSQNIATLGSYCFASTGSDSASGTRPFFYPEPFLPPTLTSLSGSEFRFSWLTNDTVVLSNPNLTVWGSETFGRTYMRCLDARDSGITTIGTGAIYANTKLEELYLPRVLTAITATGNVLGNCSAVKGIYFSGKPISFPANNSFGAMTATSPCWYLPKWDKDWEAYLADPTKAKLTEMTATDCVNYASKHGDEAMPVETLKLGTPSATVWVSGSKPMGLRWWYPNPPPKYEQVNYFDILGWEGQKATVSADDAKLFDGTVWTASPKQTDRIWLGAAGASVTYELGEDCVNTRALKFTGYRLHQACITATDVKPIVQMMPNGRAPTAWTLEGRLAATGEWVTLDEVVMTGSSANHWEYFYYSEYSEDVPPRANCSLTYAIPVAKQDSYSAFRFTPTHSHNTDNDIADATPFALMEIEFLGLVTTAEPRIDAFAQTVTGWNDLTFEGVVSGLGDNAAKGEHASSALGWVELADDDAFTENVRRSAEQSVSVNVAQQYAVSGLAGNTGYFARLVVSNDLGAVAYKALDGKAATLDAPWDAAQPVCSFDADSNVVVTVNFAGIYVPGGVLVKTYGTSAVGGTYTWLVDRTVTEAGETAIPTGFQTDSPSSCVKVVVEADGITREYVAGVRPFWVANAASAPTSISNIVVGTTFSVSASGTNLTLTALVDLGATTEVDLSTPICSADGTAMFAVASVGTALKGNADVTAVVLPDAMTAIPANAFNSCYGLQRIHLPTGLEKIASSAFNQCAALAEIEPCLPPNCTNFESSAFADCKALRAVAIPEGTTKLASSLFYRCSALGEVRLPDSLTTLSDGAFWECTALSNVWPRPIPHSVTAIGVRTYKFCQKLSVNLQPKTLVADCPGTLTLNEEALNRTFPEVVDFGGCAGLKLIGGSALTVGDSGKTDFRRLVLPPVVDFNGMTLFGNGTSGSGGVTNITFMGYPPENVTADPFTGASKAMYVVTSDGKYGDAWTQYLADHPDWVQAMTAEDRAAFRKTFPGERRIPKVKLRLGGVGAFRYLQRRPPHAMLIFIR